MALGAFQASLNILIHYERFYNGFYVLYFYMPLLGYNTNIADKLKLNVFMHI
jgi:cytochrome b561